MMATKTSDQAMSLTLPPAWSVRRPKSFVQHAYDFLGAPLRMMLLPDESNERLHLTSLRGERFAAVLSILKGRVLDVGAGDNALLRLYRRHASAEQAAAARNSVGLDVVDWGADCVVVPNCSVVPFPDASFDTVTFIACLNHIPERKEALQEARRVLKPGGQLIITMINHLIGTVGHKLWWYSEEKHREMHVEELMGIDPRDVKELIEAAGFPEVQHRRFLYWMNSLYIAR